MCIIYICMIMVPQLHQINSPLLARIGVRLWIHAIYYMYCTGACLFLRLMHYMHDNKSIGVKDKDKELCSFLFM